MDNQRGDQQPELGVPIEPYHGPKLYESDDVALVSSPRPTFTWPDERSEATHSVYDPPSYSLLRLTIKTTGALLTSWIRACGKLVAHPFRADDQALSWAKQGTAWVAFAWLMLVAAGDVGLFYGPGACAWLLFVAPACVGLVYLINSWNIVRQSHRRIATASIIVLGLAATAALVMEAGFVSKASELLGNLQECCCYTCAQAAIQWYLSH